MRTRIPFTKQYFTDHVHENNFVSAVNFKQSTFKTRSGSSVQNVSKISALKPQSDKFSLLKTALLLLVNTFSDSSVGAFTFGLYLILLNAIVLLMFANVALMSCSTELEENTL